MFDDKKVAVYVPNGPHPPCGAHALDDRGICAGTLVPIIFYQKMRRRTF